jgi:ribonuclease Z
MTNLRLAGLLLVLGVAIGSWTLTCAAWRAERVMAGVVPLDPRDFPNFSIVTLGTGGAYENPDRRGPCTAIALGDRVVLVDAGRGVAESLRAASIPVAQPDTVFLTSLLAENTVGLDDLLLTGWLGGRDHPLRLVGPTGTGALAAALEASHRAGIAARVETLGLPETAARFEVFEVAGGWAGEAGEMSVRAGALPGGPLPALAWRFEARGKSVVVAGTGWAPDPLIGFARAADVLVHEAGFVPTPELAEQIGLTTEPGRLLREAALHTSIDDVGGLATRAGVKTLVLVRLRPPPVYDIQITGLVDDHFSGRILIADDGDEITP